MVAISKKNTGSTLFYALIGILLCFYFIAISANFQECDLFKLEHMQDQNSAIDTDSTKVTDSHIHRKPKKNWTIIVYMAADNDLSHFAARNIKQMTTVGSNAEVTIIVELHVRLAGNKKITRRYLIEQGRLVHLNADDPTTQKMDSGDQQTLISCCSWAMNNYPAEHYGLILWNHGTGIIDPRPGKIVHATELFSFNPHNNKLELDRNTEFLDFINQQNRRGICWDDTTGNYLTNQKLQRALEYICNTCNNGKKLAFIGFDACLMSMLEVADLIKEYADFMIGSQEVELGTGWNYQLALSQFMQESPTPPELAKHIVAVYEKTYNKVTTDYTLSAIDLSKIERLNANVHALAKLLVQGLQTTERSEFKSGIKASRDKNNCTHFDEPSYVDLHHFYTNLKTNIAKLQTNHNQQSIAELSQLLNEGRDLIEEIVIANVASSNLAQARGLSIYFPENKLHFSYEKTPFAAHNKWAHFIYSYLFT